MRMCSTNQAHLQYEQECEAQVRCILSISEDVQCMKLNHYVLAQGELLIILSIQYIINVTYISNK